MLAVDDVFGIGKKIGDAAQLALGSLQRIPSGDHPLAQQAQVIFIRFAMIEQYAIRQGQAVDHMQHGRLAQLGDALLAQRRRQGRLLPRECSGQAGHVALDTLQATTARVVTHDGNAGHGLDGDILQVLDIARATLDLEFQILALVTQVIGGGLDLQLRSNAREHDGRADRFGYVVGGAKVEAQLLVGGIAATGDQDQRDMTGLRIGSEPATERVIVLPAQQNQVWLRPRPGGMQRLLAANQPYLVAVGQQRAEALARVDCILHNQNQFLLRPIEHPAHGDLRWHLPIHH